MKMSEEHKVRIEEEVESVVSFYARRGCTQPLTQSDMFMFEMFARMSLEMEDLANSIEQLKSKNEPTAH